MIAGSRLFTVAPWRIAAAFILLFALYQSAEGVGARLLGSPLVQAVLMILTVIAAWPVGRWLLRRRGYAAYGLEWQPRVPLWLIAGLALSFLAKGVAIVVGLRIGTYSPAAGPLPGLSVAVLALALVSTFVPSLAEDIVTRGLWWRVPRVSASCVRYVAVTAAVYVLNHVFRLADGSAEWFMLACLGIAYAVAVVRTGSLWAAVGLHWGWNLSNALVDSLVALDADRALTPYVSGVANLAIALVVMALPAIWRPDGRRQAE